MKIENPVRLSFKMNFAWLNELAKELRGIGRGPTLQEMLAMTSSVPILVEQQRHDEVLFWGKINGTARSYLIIVCYTGGLLGVKTYYGSVDGVSWFGLPLVTNTLLFHTAHSPGRITGNPLTKTQVYHPSKPIPFKEFEPLIPPKPPKEEEEEEEQQEPEKETQEEEEEKDEEEERPEYEGSAIGEDQRVAALVYRIDKDGLIFPQDSLLWKSTSTVKANPLYKGVPRDPTLDDFCRLDPQIRSENARVNGIVDTMPLLSEDLPPRGWQISQEFNSGVVKISSLIWPGLAFVSKGPRWGTVYFGTGERNVDFLFATD
jgi:hypothetical protein